MAAHRGEVDQGISVVAHVVSSHVLNGVHRIHLKVVDIRLGEAHVVFDQDITTGKHLAIRHPHVGRDNGAVVQVEGFNVEVGVNPGWWLTAAGGGFWAHNPRIKPPPTTGKSGGQ